jgi:hypothetical protein
MTRSSLLTRLQERSRYQVVLAPRRKSKLLRILIQYADHTVALQERGGSASIQIEVDRSRAGRRSTGTRCWFTALQEAEREIGEVALEDHIDRASDPVQVKRSPDLEIGIVIDFYVRERFVSIDNAERHKEKDKPTGAGRTKPVSAVHARKLDRIFAIMEYKYGRRRRVSAFNDVFVEKYIELRTTQEITFPDYYDRQPCGRVKVRTAVKELKDFGNVLGYAVKRKLISTNPLEDYPWSDWLQGDEHAVEHMEEAHTRRFELLLARPKIVDPTTGERLEAPIHRITCADGGARARFVTAMMFNHGHRWVSVQSVLCGDVALTQEETRELLRQASNHREWWAEFFPYGGILWRRSKMSYLRFTPFSRITRMEIDRWKAIHPNWMPTAPLIPQVKDWSKPVADSSVREWLRKADAVVRSDLQRLGVPQAQIERWLSGAILHGYRDHWATIMDTLGYGWEAARESGSKLDVHNHVAFCGDWAITGGTQAEVYAKLNPGILQAIMEFERAAEVHRRFSAQAADDNDSARAAIYDE